MKEFCGEVSIFRGICRKIKLDVINGRFSPGDQVPTVRALAGELSVNPNTVQRALSELENEGLLESRGKTGRFITSDTRLIDETIRAVKEEYIRDTLEKARGLGMSAEEFVSLIVSYGYSKEKGSELEKKEEID